MLRKHRSNQSYFSRQREGIALAKARGVYKGRKPIEPEKIDKAGEMIAAGKTYKEAAEAVGIGRTSLFKYLKKKDRRPDCRESHSRSDES